MTKRVSCIPCSKRKVRCDRQEPCAHCKRRKIENCTYPDESPAARIKHLEALVRSLGRDPDADCVDGNALTPESPATAVPRARPSHRDERVDYRSPARVAPDSNPVIAENGGERVYLESSSFHSWDRTDSRLYTQSKRVQNYFMTEFGSCALQSIIKPDETIDFRERHPSIQHTNLLWETYHRNVDPMCKIAFKWELEQLHRRVLTTESLESLTPGELSLVFAIYLHSVVTLSENECTKWLGQSKQALISEYQMLCENALAKANFLATSDVTLLQACTIYISASLDRINTRSLWAFIGIVLRHAERLGYHREGTILNLSPFETEKRRRIWWQLQHYDMALAVLSGSLSLLLMADWDVKIPLNIEDDDIGPWSTEFPKERSGLTGMSFCLWTSYILERQREFRRADGSRVGSAWMADRSVSLEERGGFIDNLEKGIEEKFLRYCEPVIPLHLLLSITGRSFTTNMRRLISHSDSFMQGSSEDREKRTLEQCIRCLEYDVLLNSQKPLERYRWRFKGFFPWHALVYVITEASRRVASPEADEIWELVSRLFSVNPDLSHFSDDRRKPRAAEMVLAAWTSYEQSSAANGMEKPERPSFLDSIEKLLNEGGLPADFESVPHGVPHASHQSGVQPTNNELPVFGDGEAIDDNIVNTLFNFDVNEIDWSFWSQWG